MRSLVQRAARSRLASRRFALSVIILLVAGDICHPGLPIDDRPVFPLVLRVSEEFFSSSEPAVEERVTVNLRTFGIQNRGTATVVGDLVPDFITEPESARLELVFTGTSISQTVGRQGPAIICTTNKSRFRLVAPISFDLDRGFFAGEVKGDVKVTFISHRIATTVPGIRDRIVRRVARKRLQEMSGAIRAVSEQNNRQRLVQSMDARMNDRLGELNEKWFRLRAQLQQQPWYTQAPHLYLATSETHLMVFIMPGDGKPKIDYTGLAAYPLPPAAPEAKAELLVRTDRLNLGTQGQAIVDLLKQAETPLAVIFGKDSTATIKAEDADVWSVFQLDLMDLKAASAPTQSSPGAGGHNSSVGSLLAPLADPASAPSMPD